MKKIYVISVGLMIMSLTLLSSHAYSQGQDNYYSICKQWDHYYDSLSYLKFDGDGDYSQYLRWKDFWRTRLSNGDAAQKGSLYYYRQAQEDYAAHISVYQRSTTVFSDWHSLGPGPQPIQAIGQICSIYVDTVSDKTLKTIYVGTNSSGIWRTLDGGKNWNNITDNTSSINGIVINGVTDIAGDPTNSDVLWAAASSGFISDHHNTSSGVLRSRDRGRTWEASFHPSWPNNIRTIYGILVDPNHPQRIFALGDNVVYRSVDNGSTWKVLLKISEVPADSNHSSEARYPRNIVMKPGNADIIYLGVDCNSWVGHRLSQVWQVFNPINFPDSVVATDLTLQLPLPTGQDTLFSDRLNVATTQSDSNMIFIAGNYFPSNNSDSMRFCVWKYSNGWTLEIDSNYLTQCAFGNNNNINDSKFELLVSPSDTNVIYVAGLTIEKLVKSAGSWYVQECVPESPPDPAYHEDTRDAKILKGANDILFTGTDGGLSKSSNGAQTWTNLNGNGLVITQFYGIGGANSTPEIIVGGSQDNYFWRDSANVWSHHEYGDWGNIVVDNTSPNHMFAWVFGSASGLDTSNSYGSHWHGDNIDTLGTSGPVYDTNFPHEPKLNNPPMIMNPGSKTFYLGSKNLYRTYNRGKYFERINPSGTSDLIGNGISAIGIAASDTSVLYVSFSAAPWDSTKMRFARSKDHGQTWKDLTDSVGYIVQGTFDSLLYKYTITDIAVSSSDPKTLWASFDGFEWGNDDRVIVSHDWGGHWSNLSSGLPNFPVNCLRYMNNSKDRLFVGTDVGSFYIDNSLSEWQPFNTGLPVCVVTDLEINDNIKEIRAGTFGRGIWETTLDCEYYPNSPIEISRNTTWPRDTALNTDVFIDSIYTLTILGKVSMPPLAKIYVKQGAGLIVDGGTITNKCANMWQGIEVWGRKDKPQNRMYQGYISLQRGALIENARIAITTSNKTGSNFWNTGGGIISARNATFRNNYKAVEFIGNDKGQHSTFTRVNFETTGPFVDGTSTPSDFVSMLSTQGVCFFGCNFRNTTVSGDSVPTDILTGRGIFSVNSTFHVDQYDSCSQPIVPCPNPIHFLSNFKGLNYGIRSLNTDPVSLITVNNTVFDKNFRGFYISAVDQPQVTLCKFYLPHQHVKSDTIYGLYLGGSTGYKIQENFFKCSNNSLAHPGPSSTILKNFGIVADNSGRVPNEIYNNSFDSLDIAINAQRLNKDVNDSVGLVLKCNNYQGNSYDQVIMRMFPTGIEGISTKQGAKTLDLKDPAGNRFSPYHTEYVSNPTAEVDIQNRGDNFIYFYHIQGTNFGDPRVYPNYVTPAPSVTRTPTYLVFDSAGCCPSKLNTGGGDPDAMKDAMSLSEQKIDSLTTVLNSQVDGGNTEGLNSEVFFSTNPQALQVRQDLLDQSPYLSDTVMKTAINKESVLPNEMIRDVLVANPQSAKSDNVLDELNNRAVPMPDELMDEIMIGKDSLSNKEALEAQLSAYKLSRQYSFDELVRYFKTDTINPELSHDSLILLLAGQQYPVAQYMLAFEYYYLGEWENVNHVLDNLQNLHLTDEDLKQRDEMVNYFGFLKNLSDNGRTIYLLNGDDLNSLNDLASQSTEPVRSYCLNILQANNLLRFYEPILIPENLKSSEDKNPIRTKPISKDKWMHLFPNPAHQFVIVEYNTSGLTSDSHSKLELLITTSDGKLIETTRLLKTQDQVLVNTRNYADGIYLFSLKSSGKVISTSKVSIIQ